MLHDTWTRPPPVILKYYLFQATMSFGFFWPVFTIFLLNRGLNYTQIGLLGSVSAAFIVVGEIPSGYLSDYIGRRRSLLLGNILLALSVFGFVVAQTFAAFAVLWILWALGIAFQSGSGDAWLYDTLQDRLREAEYTRVRGRGGSVNQWVSAGTMLTAGFLYSLDPRLPFVAGGLLLLSGVPVLLSLPASGRHANDDDDDSTDSDDTDDDDTVDDDDDDEFTILDAIPVIRRKLSEPPLRSFVLYTALFFAIINAADEFIQPIATQRLSLPQEGLGPLYTAFSVVAAIASYHAGTIENYLSTRWAVLLIPALVGIFFVAPLFFPLAAFPLFFVMKSANTVMKPIASGYINEHTESVGRATVLSAVSMVYALVRLPLKPLVGVVADVRTPLVALAALGCFFLACVVVFHTLESPVGSVEAETGVSSD
ncbi:Major Facilitator Superfamily protein [Haladaptatus litoreus]|uniref:Major Facilitator Superfamily protein n=1 Tax=Haladaptatus litoreus TaxID=553468 RepID=A0A1N7DYQ7_9EURY|nr:MFS transporter [Haladaptatus litoreus]SIR80970.1 Major Facilitator Superfamily protein [Haladaptatus litoreus]